MRRFAIAIGVVVGIAIALIVRHRRAPSERAEAVVLRGAMARAGVSVDLYLPAPGQPAPWIVFAEERPRADIGDAMQRRGIAVAVVSFAATGKEPTPRAVEGVADIVRDLGRRTKEYGLVERPFLVGNEAGASLGK